MDVGNLQGIANLPICVFRDEFLKAFRNNQVVIVVGGSSSGRTTQIPQWCLAEIRNPSSCSNRTEDANKCLKVVCTQTKRADAVLAATLVAEEMNVDLGAEVGFSIRFEDRSGPETSLKFATDGLLVREFVSDPSIRAYGCVILDEVQDRTLATDVLMGLLKQLVLKRPEVKVVVMTSNQTDGVFQNYFKDAAVMIVPNRSSPTLGTDPFKLGPNDGVPKILTSDLTSVVLQLKELGIDDPLSFDFIDSPKPEAVEDALEALNNFGALDDRGNLTRVGRLMVGFPLEPKMSKALISSCDLNCSGEVLSIISMLCAVVSNEAIFEEAAAAGEEESAHSVGDHLALLSVFEAFRKTEDHPQWIDGEKSKLNILYRADEIRLQLSSIMSRLDLEVKFGGVSTDDRGVNILKALLAGFFTQVAYRDEGGLYRTIKDNQVVERHPATLLKHDSEWVIYNERSNPAGKLIRTVSTIEPEWLLEVAPRFVERHLILNDEARRRLGKIAADLRTDKPVTDNNN